MNHDLNHELEQAKDEAGEVQQLPDTIRMRLDHTYRIIENSPPVRKKRYWTGLLVAVAVSGLLIIGSGFISPVMAEALKNIPVLGSIFLNDGDEGLKTASRQGMITEVQQSVAHDGITISISELMYDGSRISMVLTRQTIDGKNESFGQLGSKASQRGDVNGVQFYVDGEELGNYGYSITGVGDGAPNSDIVTLSPEGLPDEFTLEVVIRDISVSEPFRFSIPVKNSAADRAVLKSEEPKIHDNIHMEIRSFKITPATMQMIVSITGKPGQDLKEFIESVPDQYKVEDFIHIDYEVMNEKGEIAKSLGAMGSGSGSHLTFTFMYEPFPTKPKSITVRPYVYSSEHKKTYIPELEFNLPVEE
ncbi:DUF4179 domain-containing protein [Paenibacillus sp. Cedars]|uniref:DUF4179 domain-containing protein n=1 Tax=Paenibacillus sp. Cedars TaxID=1980674 RepID=UPI00116304F3|nr:DUF4179 domain-containing protein [Paenibacillus sp. Cedars]AWP30000.1 hypothetical protein B9D94_26805 [Paenibacillus sp. Cedars]